MSINLQTKGLRLIYLSELMSRENNYNMDENFYSGPHQVVRNQSEKQTSEIF